MALFSKRSAGGAPLGDLFRSTLLSSLASFLSLFQSALSEARPGTLAEVRARSLSAFQFSLQDARPGFESFFVLSTARADDGVAAPWTEGGGVGVAAWTEGGEVGSSNVIVADGVGAGRSSVVVEERADGGGVESSSFVVDDESSRGVDDGGPDESSRGVAAMAATCTQRSKPNRTKRKREGKLTRWRQISRRGKRSECEDGSGGLRLSYACFYTLDLAYRVRKYVFLLYFCMTNRHARAAS